VDAIAQQAVHRLQL